MRTELPLICANEYLKCCRFIVSHKFNSRKPISFTILDCTTGTFSLLRSYYILLLAYKLNFANNVNLFQSTWYRAPGVNSNELTWYRARCCSSGWETICSWTRPSLETEDRAEDSVGVVPGGRRFPMLPRLA